MNKKIYVILTIICLISFIKMLAVINGNDTYYETKKEVIGKITYIKKDKEKITFDLKSKQKYRITIYEEFIYDLNGVTLTIKKCPNNTFK